MNKISKRLILNNVNTNLLKRNVSFTGTADAVRCYECSAYKNEPCGVDVDRTTPIKDGCSFCTVYVGTLDQGKVHYIKRL